MKFPVVIASFFASCTASLASTGDINPVTRVVELLNDISSDIEKESKAEEALFESFVCWAKSMISQKTQSNLEAEVENQDLQTYISDLEAGRIELTSERVDLTKELEGFSADIDAATRLRLEQKNDFEDAKAEMEKGIDALTKAIDVLHTATVGHEKGVLLSTAFEAQATFEVRSRESEALRYTTEIAGRVLTKGDVAFLQRLLTGEVPEVDWKKLNRKAKFKMDYKARSFKIQSVLAKLLEAFTSDLKEAEAKEAKAVELYTKLMESKGAEKGSVQEALLRMEKETGARGLSKEEASRQSEALKIQISLDKKYIAEVREVLATKTKEWQARQKLRAGEVAAIAKAVSILHSDDARNLLKRSFASQAKGTSLLQVSAESLSRHVADVLGAAGRAGSDPRLGALVQTANAGHFDEVLQAIDKMLAVLKREEEEDLAKKDKCESDRAEDTRQASFLSRGMDELTGTITSNKAEIESLTKTLKEIAKQQEGINKELKEAEQLRKKENAEWQIADKEDKDSKALVLEAKGVLAKFYADNGLMFVQQPKVSDKPFVSEAGEAPPPPPATWEGGYAGKKEEQTGVIALLELIAEDITKDIQKTLDEEKAAEVLFQKTKTVLEAELENLKVMETTTSERRALLEQAVSSDTADRHGKKGELQVVMQRIRDAEPDCDYFTVNYSLRAKNRQIEVDGLNKAKIILSGGVFGKIADPDRDMKPGDAFLQRHRF